MTDQPSTPESWEKEFDEKFVGGWDAIPEDSPYIPSIKKFIQSLIDATLEEAAEANDMLIGDLLWIQEKIDGGLSSVGEDFEKLAQNMKTTIRSLKK